MNQERSLLVIAHPGHELRLYGWLQETNPLIVILTDGSGATGASRIDLSEEAVSSLGGKIVTAGRFAEPELYSLIMNGHTEPLTGFVDDLADLILRENIGAVVCDAAEGYHPGHDLCLPLTRAALTRCDREGQIDHYEYRVVGDPRPDADHNENALLTLSDATLREKIDRSRRYAAESGSALMQEVEQMFDLFGEEAFRYEALRRAGSEPATLHDGLRYYELRGEQQVRSGRYKTVLRHAEHMLPIEAALNAHAFSSPGKSC